MRGNPRIEIGFVARAHGIRGEVVMMTHDPDSTVLMDVESIWVGDVSFAIAKARRANQGFLIALKGVDDRNRAETFKGKAVEIDRELLELDEDDVLLDDMLGCRVVLADGTDWGVVHAVENGAMQDRLIIHHNGREKMLPLVDAFVTGIDIEQGVIIVDPPEGLPDSPIVGHQADDDSSDEQLDDADDETEA